MIYMTWYDIWYMIWYIWYMIRYDIWYDMIWYIFNCNWVATPWQLFSTHIHTNNTENVTKQTMQRITQKIHRTTQLGRVRAVPRLCGFYPGICLTTEEKAYGKTSVRVVIHEHKWEYNFPADLKECRVNGRRRTDSSQILCCYNSRLQMPCKTPLHDKQFL